MSSLAPPVRRGKASLLIRINATCYTVRQDPKPGCPRQWRLRKLDTGPRVEYFAAKIPGSGRLVCTCPDFCRHRQINTFKCKHIKALVAVGLLSPRKPRPCESRDRMVLKALSLGGSL